MRLNGIAYNTGCTAYILWYEACISLIAVHGRKANGEWKDKNKCVDKLNLKSNGFWQRKLGYV